MLVMNHELIRNSNVRVLIVTDYLRLCFLAAMNRSA